MTKLSATTKIVYTIIQFNLKNEIYWIISISKGIKKNAAAMCNFHFLALQEERVNSVWE